MKLRELVRSVFGPSARGRELAVALVRVRPPRRTGHVDRRDAWQER